MLFPHSKEKQTCDEEASQSEQIILSIGQMEESPISQSIRSSLLNMCLHMSSVRSLNYYLLPCVKSNRDP